MINWDDVDLLDLLERANPYHIHGRNPSKAHQYCIRFNQADLDELVLALKRKRMNP